MNVQCQGCGAFAGGIKPTAPCQYCGITICSGCRTGHEARCEDIQKQRKAGQGATVLQTFDSPSELPPVPEAPAVDTADHSFDSAVQAEVPIPAEHEAGATVAADISPLDPGGLLQGLTIAPGAVVVVDDRPADLQQQTPEAIAALPEGSVTLVEVPQLTPEELAALHMESEGPLHPESETAIVPAPPEDLDIPF